MWAGKEADGITFNTLDRKKEPRFNPYTNYIASELDPARALFNQLWELGNSLAAITGTIPAQYKEDPTNNPDLEPGKQLTDCVKAGGPSGLQY